MTIPTWLLRRTSGIFRTARLHPCPRCHHPILTGLDDDTAARTAHADPTPITPLGEALALLTGRTTYDLMTTHGRRELWRRDQWHITSTRKWPVVPEHKCHQPLNDHLDTTWTHHQHTHTPTEPPF